ncbi:MAG: hypothetical protein ACRC7V_01450 [Lachnospiraceae bacterium]
MLEEKNMLDIFELSTYDELFQMRLLQDAFNFSAKQAQFTTEKI